MAPPISFSTQGTRKVLQWHCISNLLVSTAVCQWLVSGFLVGKWRYFLFLLTVPGCGWPWVPSTVQEAVPWKDEHSGKAPGFPGKEIFEGRKVQPQTAGMVAAAYKRKQLHRTHGAASQKRHRDKVKVSGCISLAEEKDFFFLKFLQNLRSSDTSMHAFMQSDR